MRILSPMLAFVVGSIATPVAFTLLAVSGVLGFDAISQPPTWEAALAQRALFAGVDVRARTVSNTFDTSDPGVVAAGKKIYSDDCSGCHGTPKAVSSWGARNFYPRVPQFWQQAVSIRPEQAFVIVRDGIRYSGMGAWRGLLTERQMWEVATFVSTLNSRADTHRKDTRKDS